MAERNDMTMETIKRFLDLLGKQGIKVDSVYLYGSYVKQTANDWSDIDVAIISSDFKESRYLERINLMKLASEVDKRIEPVPFRPEDFNDNDPLVWEILTKGRLISTMP